MTKRTQYRKKAKAGVAKKDHKALAKLVKDNREETRWLDTPTAVSPSTTATITCLTGNIAQGDDINNRSGDKIRIHGIKCNYAMELTSGTATPVCKVRVIHFQMKTMLAGGIPAASTILSNPTNVNSHFNPIYSPNFRVLRDRSYSVSAVEAKGHVGSFTLKAATTASFYGTTVNTIDRNHIFELVMSDQSALLPTWTTMYRTAYHP